MRLLAGFLALALAQEAEVAQEEAASSDLGRTGDNGGDDGEDRHYGYGGYDYYGGGHSHYGGHSHGYDHHHHGYYGGGKSQNTQTHGLGTLITNRVEGIMGNGRICWQCNERSYGHCLAGSATKGDTNRHGAAYCVGEEYFCFIEERRIIRHDGNDYDYEVGQPWSSNVPTTYQEQNIDHSTSNQVHPTTEIRIQMGCQQPMACLRQQNMNYKIDMGLPFFSIATVPLVTNPVAKYPGLAREGMCRLGVDWQDYAHGIHSTTTDQWRQKNWRSIGIDRRFGAVEHHYHYGKGTESVCHYCCDPLLEFSDTDSNPLTPYDYNGCNYNAVSAGQTAISDGTTVDNSSGITGNVFINRHQLWSAPIWYDARQYHGMFRNPHTQYPRKVQAYNTAANTPNQEG